MKNAILLILFTFLNTTLFAQNYDIKYGDIEYKSVKSFIRKYKDNSANLERLSEFYNLSIIAILAPDTIANDIIEYNPILRQEIAKYREIIINGNYITNFSLDSLGISKKEAKRYIINGGVYIDTFNFRARNNPTPQIYTYSKIDSDLIENITIYKEVINGETRTKILSREIKISPTNATENHPPKEHKHKFTIIAGLNNSYFKAKSMAWNGFYGSPTDEESVFEDIFSYNIGVGYDINLDKLHKFNIITTLKFANSGSVEKYEEIRIRMNTNYLKLSSMITWHGVGIGPYIAHGVGGKFKWSDNNTTHSYHAFKNSGNTMNLNRLDYGVIFGFSHQIEDRISFSYLFELGYANIFKGSYMETEFPGINIRNKALTISVGYIIIPKKNTKT